MAKLASAVGRNLARPTFVRHHHELIPRSGNFGQTLDLYGDRRTRRFDGLAILVKHGANATVSRSRQNNITGFESSALDQHRGNWSATLVKLRLDHQALGHGLDRCAQLQNLGLQQHLLQQFINALTGLGRHGDER